jgi:hypothetical protein
MDNWGQGTFTLCVSRLYRRAIGIAFEGDGRLFPLHPGIERIMQEEIGEDGAATAPLRNPLSPLDEGAILALHGGLYPPCHIQEDPWIKSQWVMRTPAGSLEVA